MSEENQTLSHWRRLARNGDTVVLEVETSGVSEESLEKLKKLKLKAYKFSSDLSSPQGTIFADQIVRGGFHANASCRVYIGPTRLQFFEYGDRASTDTRWDDFLILSTLMAEPGFTLRAWNLSEAHSETGERAPIASGSDQGSLVAVLSAPRERLR